MIRKILPSLFVVLSAFVANGADAQDPLASVRACAAKGDDAARLACYDAAMQSARPATAAVAGAEAAAAASEPASRAIAEENFGYRGTVAREELDRKEAAQPKLERLEAKITAVSAKPHGEFVVTLDNGQVWEQQRPDSKVRPSVGDAISIKPGTFSSYSLVTATGRTTKVTRIR